MTLVKSAPKKSFAQKTDFSIGFRMVLHSVWQLTAIYIQWTFLLEPERHRENISQLSNMVFINDMKKLRYVWIHRFG
jgi:hypothetical protein